MEKCGKVWRQERAGTAGHQARMGVTSIADAGAAREMRACSACAGDYEDPDRTAWKPDDAEDEERDGEARGGKEEFPAEE